LSEPDVVVYERMLRTPAKACMSYISHRNVNVKISEWSYNVQKDSKYIKCNEDRVMQWDCSLLVIT